MHGLFVGRVGGWWYVVNLCEWYAHGCFGLGEECLIFFGYECAILCKERDEVSDGTAMGFVVDIEWYVCV